MLKMIATAPFEETHTVSIKELADQLGVDYLEAQGFIKVGVSLGYIKTLPPRKVEGKKGKPTNLYAVPTCLQLTLHDELVPQKMSEAELSGLKAQAIKVA